MSWKIRTTFVGETGAPYVNTTHWNDGIGLRVEDAVDNVHTMWSAIAARISSDLTITVEPEVSVCNDTTGEVTGVVSHTTTPFAGIGSGALLPPATQGLIRLNTGVWHAGRQIIGHIYIPGLTTASMASGHLSTDAMATFSDAYALVLDGGGGLTSPRPQIFSKTASRTVDVASASVPSKFAILRSRRD